MALQLTQLARKPNVAYDELVRTIEHDPLLVANLLKMAQSPIYGGRSRVKSLRDGLQRLGINTLRDITWQVVLGMRVFRSSDYAPMMERVQRHSVFTGYAARLVAGHANAPGDHAFLCGLLHDVGWSGALMVASEQMPKPSNDDELFMAIDRIHAETCQSMTALWGLAPEIVEAVGRHHDREINASSLPTMVSVLCIAESLADQHGFGLEAASEEGERLGLDEHLVGRVEHAAEVLSLTTKLALLRDEAARIAERLQDGP